MTNYYQCDVCDKTMSQNDTIPKFEAVGVTHLCNKCLNPTEFAFSVCTADQPEPSFGFCDGCDELEAELHLMDGDWLCDKCKATVTRCPQCHKRSNIRGMCIHCWEPACGTAADELMAQEDKVKANENKTMVEALEDLKKDCADHWEMIKARVFITLFLVWVCFAVWGKYVS